MIKNFKTMIVALLLAFSPLTQSAPAMNNEYALVFFHLSTCSECHKFAPKVKALQLEENALVYDFSFDGKPIPDFYTPIPATKDIMDAFFPENDAIAPATFIINVNTGKYVRLTRGDVNYAQFKSSYKEVMATPSILDDLR